MNNGIRAFSFDIKSSTKVGTISAGAFVADTMSSVAVSVSTMTCGTATYGQIYQAYSLSVPVMFSFDVSMDSAISGGAFMLTVSGQNFDQWTVIMDHGACTPGALDWVNAADMMYTFYRTDNNSSSVTLAIFESFTDLDLAKLKRPSLETTSRLVTLSSSRTYYFGGAYSVSAGTPIPDQEASVTFRGWMFPPIPTLSTATLWP